MQKTQKKSKVFNESRYHSPKKSFSQGVKTYVSSLMNPVFKSGTIQPTEHLKALSKKAKALKAISSYVFFHPILAAKGFRKAHKELTLTPEQNAIRHNYGIIDIEKAKERAQYLNFEKKKYEARLLGLNKNSKNSEYGTKDKKRIAQLIEENKYKQKLIQAQMNNMTHNLTRGKKTNKVLSEARINNSINLKNHSIVPIKELTLLEKINSIQKHKQQQDKHQKPTIETQ